MRHQLEEAREKFRKEEEIRIRKQIEQEVELKLKDKQNEAEELKEQNKKLQEQTLETNKLLRQLQKQLAEKDVEMEKKLQAEEEKIRLEVRRRADEENNLKNREKDKKLDDALKMAEEYKRKFEQGSQQTQGEVLEEFLENTLRTTFIYDEIQPVPKGIRGADVIQVVRNKFGKTAGKIVWESKRTKVWAGDWIAKLKEDKRSVKADVAVLVSNVLPSGVKGFGNHDGVWVANYESILGVATALRIMLLEVAIAKSGSMTTSEAKDRLFEFVQSNEFRNRIEAISEAFKSRREEIEIEKKWFNKKWAKEEKLISGVLMNNAGLKGEIEAVTGVKFEDSDTLALEPGDDES